MVDIRENFVTEVCSKYKPYWKNMRKMFSWKVVYGWIKLQKKEKILFSYEVQCISTKKNLSKR